MKLLMKRIFIFHTQEIPGVYTGMGKKTALILLDAHLYEIPEYMQFTKRLT